MPARQRALLEPAGHDPGRRLGARGRARQGAHACRRLAVALPSLSLLPAGARGRAQLQLSGMWAPPSAAACSPCCPPQAHILIFLIAVVQVLYACVSMLLCLYKVRPLAPLQALTWAVSPGLRCTSWP